MITYILQTLTVLILVMILSGVYMVAKNQVRMVEVEISYFDKIINYLKYNYDSDYAVVERMLRDVHLGKDDESNER